MRDLLKDFFKFIRSSYAVIGFICGFLAVVAITAVAVLFLSKSDMPQSSDQTLNQTNRPTLDRLPETAPTLVEEAGAFVPTDLPVTYRVQAGDSSWRVALAFYGCGENYQDIETANSLSAGQYLEVGQIITIPRTAIRCQVLQPELERPQLSSNLEPAPSTEQPMADSDRQKPSNSTHYTVVAGDSLWNIALDKLGEGRKWPELYARNQAVVGANPDLIYPGQVLELPR